MAMHPTFPADFPAEIWLRIFHFATTTSASPKLHETQYRPFFDMPTEREYCGLAQATTTSLSIILVCRQFYHLALEFVYDRVRLHHGTLGLAQSLRKSLGGAECGRWVKRVELSVTEYETQPYPITPSDILRACPSVEVLAKFDDDLLPHDLHDHVDLTNLKRFDWWCAHYRDGDHKFDIDDDDVDPTCGISFLRHVLRRAPNLNYLSISKRHSKRLNEMDRFGPIEIPSITTLRLEFLSERVLQRELSKWTLPNLRVLVADYTPLAMLRPHLRLLPKFAPTVEVVEVIDDQNSFDDPYCLETLLLTFPLLLELNYHVEFLHATLGLSSPATLLRTIGLHNKPNPTLRHSQWSDSTSADKPVWAHVQAHFSMLNRTNFPSLEFVVLYGDWSSELWEPRLAVLRERLMTLGVRFEVVNTTESV